MLKVLHWKRYKNTDVEDSDVEVTEGVTEESEEADVSSEETEAQPYTIELNDGILNLNFNLEYDNKVRSGSASIDTTILGKCYDIFVIETDTFEFRVVPSYEYCNRNGFGTNAFDRKKVARVVVDDVGDIFVVLIFACEDIDGYPNVEMVFGEHPASWYLKQECTWFANRWAEAAKKSSLIRGVDEYRSISYLEAQVDLLTKLVLSLAKDKDLDGYTLLEEANKYSVLNIKPDADILKEFEENKKGFRTLQEVYYEILHG